MHRDRQTDAHVKAVCRRSRDGVTLGTAVCRAEGPAPVPGLTPCPLPPSQVGLSGAAHQRPLQRQPAGLRGGRGGGRRVRGGEARWGPGAPASPTPHHRVPRELGRAPRSVQSGLPAPALRLAGEKGSRAFRKHFYRLHSMRMKNTERIPSYKAPRLKPAVLLTLLQPPPQPIPSVCPSP